MIYYIYEIWDKKNNIPVYVGYAKGSPSQKYKRYEKHIKEAVAVKEKRLSDTSKINMYKVNVLLQCQEVEYKFPYQGLSYDEVCEAEKQLIEKYGRRIIGTGTLTNLDSGGRGGMTRTPETCKKISSRLKGRESQLKGRSLKPHSEETKKKIKESLADFYQSDEGELYRQAVSDRESGKTIPDKTRKKISESLRGRPSPMKGRVGWSKGLTKDTDPRLAEAAKKLSAAKKGTAAHNKGKPSGKKGMSYEEIYGVETAQKMRDTRKGRQWYNNGETSKLLSADNVDEFITLGWVKGRL